MEPLSHVEEAIFEALKETEALGCHQLLTEAVILLGNARSKVGEYLEQNPIRMPQDRPLVLKRIDHTVDGELIQLAVVPGNSAIGVTLLTDDGKEEGRYMARPEATYGGIKMDGVTVETLSELLDMVMFDGAEFNIKIVSPSHGYPATSVWFVRPEKGV